MQKHEVILTKKYFIDKGGERECYMHPEDSSKVIKVVHRKGKHNMGIEKSVPFRFRYDNYPLKVDDF